MSKHSQPPRAVAGKCNSDEQGDKKHRRKAGKREKKTHHTPTRNTNRVDSSPSDDGKKYPMSKKRDKPRATASTNSGKYEEPAQENSDEDSATDRELQRYPVSRTEVYGGRATPFEKRQSQEFRKEEGSSSSKNSEKIDGTFSTPTPQKKQPVHH